jgi:DNA mismatch repair protein MutL
VSTIRRLSQSLINKIAAGEVIERPASVVKELVENAVDAGAARIDVSVASGGTDMVRVVDNGSGIAADELSLAVASHATSKLLDADSLFSVATLGFRGEALASIAEVSRLVIRSRTHDSPGGAEMEVVGGRAQEPVPCGCPPGTAVEVRNLFFNTPVRRKFLRTPQTEFGHASEAFARIALANPHIHFSFKHNDKAVHDLPASEGWLERIAKVLGRQLAENLIWVESVDRDVRLAGYVAHPSQSRSNNRMQYLFLNGRHIRDRSLQHALGEAFRGLLMTGRYPIAILALEMPPQMVDVNVHPTKLEVRFQDSGRLYSQLLSTLRTRFLTTDLTTQVRTAPEEDPSGAHDQAEASRLGKELIGWARGDVAGAGTAGPPAREASSGQFPAFAGGPHAPETAKPQTPREPAPRDFPVAGSPAPAPAGIGPAPLAKPDDRRAHGPARAMQIHNRYLVAESKDGVMVIDQHALHERILYEQLRQRIEAGSIESQTLLVPEPVDLSPSEFAAAIENRPVLARLGVQIEPFGGDTMLVSSYPAMLANMNPADVLHGLLEPLLAGGKQPSCRDLLDEMLHMLACKAAVKAGDRLSPDEITALLDQRHLIDDPHHCPHGRPTAVVFSREELDKQFKRV